jgi:diaminopimelate decarboxylase
MDEVQEWVQRFDLKVERLHTHIGSGSDPQVWQRVASLSMDLVKKFPGAKSLNLGGGYKIGRMSHEKTTDLQQVGQPVKEAFEKLAHETGRRLHLEIEPGTWLLGNACCVLSTARDIVSTGPDGYQFIKSDTGMTEILRPSLYAAQHPISVISRSGETHTSQYVVVGHCCESGDLLTPDSLDAEKLAPRELIRAFPGDLLVIDGAGAYCASMSAKNYNSFPEAPEILLKADGSHRLIRRRQTLEQILENEIPA